MRGAKVKPPDDGRISGDILFGRNLNLNALFISSKNTNFQQVTI